VRRYHESLQQQIAIFLAADGPKNVQGFSARVDFKGIQPVRFEHTAWDLALATGSLSYIEPDLAYSLSRTYTAQGALERMQDTFSESALSPVSFAGGDLTGLGVAMQAYLTDVVLQEPRLLERYADLAAMIEAVVGPAPLDE
jgi:hypothetical protein